MLKEKDNKRATALKENLKISGIWP